MNDFISGLIKEKLFTSEEKERINYAMKFLKIKTMREFFKYSVLSTVDRAEDLEAHLSNLESNKRDFQNRNVESKATNI